MQSRSKLIKILFSLTVFTLTWTTEIKATTAATPLDSIVAVVNSDIITQTELNQAIKITITRLKAQHIALPPKSNLQLTVLNQLINQKLQLQLAKRSGMRVGKKQIAAYLTAIAKSQNTSVANVRKNFKASGLSQHQLDQTIRQQMLISAVQHQALYSKLKPTKEEIDQIKQKINLNRNNHTSIKIKDILFATADNIDSDKLIEVKNQALLAIKKLQAGAKASSIGNAEINDWSWKNLNQLPSVFVNAITKDQSKRIVGPIKAGNGYHILVIMDRRDDNPPAPTEQQISQMAMQEKFMPAMIKWIKKLRSRAYIKIYLQQ